MIHLFTWNTPNGIKSLLMLEECGLDYTLHPIDISSGAQKADEFLTVNPNGRIPAMIDTDQTGSGAADGVEGLRLFESGAILLHLARLTNRFLPTEAQAHADCLSWTFWQVGGLGPMVGQVHWFERNAPKEGPGLERFRKESARLLNVLERALDGRDYLAGDYSIADMMVWKWAAAAMEALDGDWVGVSAWVSRIAARPAVKRAVKVAGELTGG